MPRGAVTRTLRLVTCSTAWLRAKVGVRHGNARASGLVAALACIGGCFTGSDASGLPCEKDLDCGLRQRCESGFCGGPPSSETSSSTTDAVTTSDSSTTDVPADCGNGIVEDDESCEPPVALQNGPECDRDCTLPLCGDGIENLDATDVETCDASKDNGVLDSATCDADCTPVACGDNLRNSVVEACDDADADDYDGCTSQCFRTFFADPMTSATKDWTVETPMYVADLPRGGTTPAYSLPAESSPAIPGRSEPTGWRHPTNRWESGPVPYIGFPDEFQGAPGTTRLVSREVELSLDLDGDGDSEDDAALRGQVRYELHFRHVYAFDGCGEAPQDGDGGIIRVHDVEADTYEAVAPVGGYTETIRGGNECLGSPVTPRPPNPIVLDAPPTPYGPVAGFSGSREMMGAVVVDLDAYRGRTIRIVFEMGFDCLSCENPRDDAWKIDSLIVAPFPR
jgi:hypothetical protein